MSCLCVTQDRPAFMPWLSWAFTQQTWQHKELIVVDSSAEPSLADLPPGVQLIRARPGTRVAEKRNLAIEQARGEVVAWFDDDDWQHPQRLELLMAELRTGAPVVGPCEAWFVDLWSDKCQRYSGSEVIFNGALFLRDIARSERFDPSRVRGSDTVWLRALAARHGAGFRRLQTLLFFWLVHERNLSNSRSRRPCWAPAAGLRARVGDDLWLQTELQIARLRERLAAQRGAARRAPATSASVKSQSSGRAARGVPAIVGNWAGSAARALARPSQRLASPRPRALPIVATHEALSKLPVSAFVKATVLDVPYLETMTRHMLEQAKFEFAERVLVIDARLEFSGKYRSRARFERRALEAATARLLAARVIDRVIDVPYDPSEIERVLGRYFLHCGTKVPTHAVTGGPIYPTLYGLEQMSSDFIVQFDADMFFHVPGPSWIETGLGVLSAHPDVWFAMLHGGPPAGPSRSEASLGALNSRRASWDEALHGWRFQTVSTRYFLTDRRRLRNRVPVVRRGGGVLPLEQCLSAALRQHRAARVGLPSMVGWDLHAHSHAAPFSEWAEAITGLVQRGLVPDSQRGTYDLRLDRPAMRAAWARTLEQALAETPRAQPLSVSESLAGTI